MAADGPEFSVPGRLNLSQICDPTVAPYFSAIAR